MTKCLESIHEGEAILVFFRDLSVKFLGKSKFLLLVVVVVEGGQDVDASGDNCRNGPTQLVDLEEVDCAIEPVELNGIKLANQPCQFLSD